MDYYESLRMEYSEARGDASTPEPKREGVEDRWLWITKSDYGLLRIIQNQ